MLLRFRLLVTTILITALPALAQNHIELENQNPGDSDWVLTKPGNDTRKQVKGYTNRSSVNLGEQIDFFVHTENAESFKVEIFRLGFYGGLGARKIISSPIIAGSLQPDCPLDLQDGLRQCSWSSNYSLLIPQDWTTGSFVAKLTNTSGFQNYVPFIVTDKNRTTELLYQAPVLTYLAYNNYPDDGLTGKSTYDHRSYGPNTIALGNKKRAVRVSLNRPLENDGATLLFNYEHELIMFIEEKGYNIRYQNNIDSHLDTASLLTVNGIISGGHDEYWTREMYNAFYSARDNTANPVNIAFMGANAVFWQVRLAEDNGLEPRVMEVYKDYAADPETEPDLKTVTFRVNRPKPGGGTISKAEQQLVGVQYIDYWNAQNATPLIATNTDHWIFTGTDITENESFPGLIGIEVDILFPAETYTPGENGALATPYRLNNATGQPYTGNAARVFGYPQPQVISQTMLGQSPWDGISWKGVVGHTSFYEALSGAHVFASATLLWQRALANSPLRNEKVRKLTENIFNIMRGDDIPELSGPSLSVSSTYSSETGGKAYLVAKLSEPAQSDVSFTVSTEEFEALADEDYLPLVDQPYTIQSGQDRVTVIVDLIDDQIHEETFEKFFVRISNVLGATFDSSMLSEIIIKDNDPDTDLTPPVLTVTSTYTSEISDQAYLVAKLSKPAISDVIFEISTEDFEALANEDYVPQTNQSYTIQAGQDRATILVSLIDDPIHEATFEKFFVNVANVSGATFDSSVVSEIIIKDNDPDPDPSPPELTLSSTYAAEVAEKSYLVASLSKTFSEDVSFTLQTSDLEAIAGDDYQALENQVFTIAAGAKSLTIIIPLIDDSEIESHIERFNIAITSATNATYTDGVLSEVRIVDNE